MKPEAGDALLNSAMTLMGEIAPLLEGGYGSGTVNTIGAMMMIAAQEFDRAADARVKAIAELRKLFSEAVEVVEATALKSKLRDAIGGKEDDLRIVTLSDSLKKLRSVLINLHVHVEQSNDPKLNEIEDRIWRHLALDTERFGIVMG